MPSTAMAVLLIARMLVGTPWELASGSEEPRQVRRASVVVDATAVDEDGAPEALARRITRTGLAVLRRAALAPGGPRDPAFVVTVRPLAEDIGFTAAIAVRRRGEVEPLEQVECPLCTERELVVKVQRELTLFVPQLTAPPV
jgi:hypothetical protein